MAQPALRQALPARTPGRACVAPNTHAHHPIPPVPGPEAGVCAPPPHISAKGNAFAPLGSAYRDVSPRTIPQPLARLRLPPMKKNFKKTGKIASGIISTSFPLPPSIGCIKLHPGPRLSGRERDISTQDDLWLIELKVDPRQTIPTKSTPCLLDFCVNLSVLSCHRVYFSLASMNGQQLKINRARESETS